MSNVIKGAGNWVSSVLGFHGIKGTVSGIGLNGWNGVKAATGGMAQPAQPVTPTDTTPAMPDYNYLQGQQQTAIDAMRLRSGRLSTILSQPSQQLGG